MFTAIATIIAVLTLNFLVINDSALALFTYLYDISTDLQNRCQVPLSPHVDSQGKFSPYKHPTSLQRSRDLQGNRRKSHGLYLQQCSHRQCFTEAGIIVADAERNRVPLNLVVVGSNMTPSLGCYLVHR
jgi:hypothetical protein